ncbi:DNA polymerase III subunit gamma/tau [Ideonella azotifigens]|uniref:DNA polymerase III subunit gamma/tau n=2 Tax=Ideonella azotifigens TaxID=513160 RepID=A0ABN1K7Y6_9BURK|nr:DNA polymerase III subunit gamma/tau [Ideonella azotifigens]MCD2342975.1 DNA polymerase III subunit gamma/tau [Ideonella azotifigens]
MSYVVLARKYRPRSFEEMVGQDHVVRALTHALEQQRLHHAYLFTGTRGIGKTTVSRILAKSLNCTGPDGTGGITARPCGQCTACREIDADRYIDYMELDAASNRSIDEIRELIERSAYKPTVGRFKVFMIDEAHQLTKDAFNALLKTLEEPPEYLKFVLATTDPEKMLPTVLSRCLQFNLRPMAPQTVLEHLTRVLEAESVAAEPGALRLLSRAARGSMRDALSLTDQAIAYGGGQLQEPAVRAMLGTVDRSHALRLVGALAQRDGKAVLAEVDGLRAQGLSAAGTLEEIARLLQHMAVEQAVPGALDETDPDMEAPRQLAPQLAQDETQLLYSMVLHGRAELSLAPDEYAGLVMVLLRFLAFPSAGGEGRVPAAPAVRPTAALVASPQVASTSVSPPRPAVASVPTPAPSPASVATKPAAAPAVAPPPVVAQPPAAVPKPVSVASHLAPPVAVPAAPPSRASLARKPSAIDEPPPWMDEAPFEGEAAPRVAARALRAAEPEPEPAAPRGPASAMASRLAQARDAAAQRERDAGDALMVAEPLGEAEDFDEAPLARPTPAPERDLALLRVPRTALGDQWAEAVAGMSASGSLVALVRALAMQAELIAQVPAGEEGAVRWSLRVERETLRAPPLVEKLQAALRNWSGQAELVLDVASGVALDSPALRDAEQARLRQREAELVVQSHPLVQSLLAQFSTARIVPGSIKPT